MQVNVHVQWDLGDGAAQPLTPIERDALKQVYQISEVTWQAWFQHWFEHLQPSISPIQTYELSLLLTDDAAIQGLNATYRQLDRPTDVLAFATLDSTNRPTALWSEMPVELGDIIISVETATQQAREQHHTLQEELAWLATHGLLHLLGWDHPTPERLQEMLAQQQALINLINVSAVTGYS
ncbi:rRNA maturation RNase YbeY [Acaryochloris sp. IP29b_bin.148]|uniref:rRNA maturation RNase YbeY n=1 Tax=Acaryochloris sp. IP29b_bin.148 TaxID=2969218 RepID=UPI00260AE8D3|nr:rRNA maturation RNase YbeY [Acaryochloris sp. IP29b_bin.148]